MKIISSLALACLLIGLSAPAFACGGHKDKVGDETITTNQSQKDDKTADHTCTDECDHDKDDAQQEQKSSGESNA